MKFAICNELFVDWPHDDAFRAAREAGYTGIEFAPFTLAKDARSVTPELRRQLRKLLADHQLECVGLHWLLAKTEGYYLTSPDPAVQARTAEYLKSLAELCDDLGGRIMVLGSPQQRNLLPGVSHEHAMHFAAETISKAVATLEQLDVMLAVEPLGPSEGNFLLTAEDGMRLCDLIDSPNVRLHLDVKAMSSEAAPIPEIISNSAEYLVHFHANDPNRRGPGMGAMDFVPIFTALREIGYQGWVSVEVFDYEPGVQKTLDDSMRYMRACLDEVDAD